MTGSADRTRCADCGRRVTRDAAETLDGGATHYCADHGAMRGCCAGGVPRLPMRRRAPLVVGGPRRPRPGVRYR